jgi:hypothetical protein
MLKGLLVIFTHKCKNKVDVVFQLNGKFMQNKGDVSAERLLHQVDNRDLLD